ncbi:MAG: hypothetical protein WC397_00490 [Candidatus Paceibacterota bacterium]|jgi:hypothetical protein
MVKKIFDIIPPGYNQGEEGRARSFVSRSNLKKKSSGGGPSSFPAKFVLPLFVVAAAGAGAAYFFVEAKAVVEIWPKQEMVKIEEQITIKDGATKIDADQKIIPGSVIEDVLDYKETFEATGQSESKTKAVGALRIYNECDPVRSFNFVKGTQFVSKDSKLIFKSLSEIKIPAAKYEKGKISAGYVDVQIEAAEGGADYNIEPEKFSVLKLSGTNCIWGENSKAIRGGSEEGAKVVSAQDLAKAKDQFTQNAFKAGEGSLKKKIPITMRLLSNFMSQEISGELSISAKEKDATDAFEMSAKIVSKVLVFKDSDVGDYFTALVAGSSSGKKIVDKSLQPVFDAKNIDFSQKSGQLGLSGSLKTYILDDEEKVKNSLTGQPLDYAESLLGKTPGAEKTGIKVSPFWKTKVPSDADKVEIKIIF